MSDKPRHSTWSPGGPAYTVEHHAPNIPDPVWVNLDLVYDTARSSADGSRKHVDGLEMSGRVPGLLTGWIDLYQGGRLGIVNIDVPYADGRRRRSGHELWIPDYALTPRRSGPKILGHHAR